MSETLWSVALVVVFVLIGGAFAAAEMALVSLRDSQARALATRGRRGRTVARLNEDPNRFLAGVQIGVTLAGFLSAAFGGATLADDLAPGLEDLGLSPRVAEPTALVLVTLTIAYLSLVLGELVPKRLALQRAESFAIALGPLVDKISRAATPLIWFLGRSTDVVVRLFGGDPSVQREEITEAELREMVGHHETLGEEERRIVDEVFDAGDRLIREVMVPRTEVDFLSGDLPVSKAAREALARPHSRYPVIDGSADDVIGFVHVRDLLAPDVMGRNIRLRELVRECLILPGTRPLLAALADLRREKVHLAIVADEYGGTAGIVTIEDLVEQLVGDIRDEYDTEPETTRHVTGEVEVDGLLNLDDFEDEVGVALPDGPYETVAGFLMSRLGRLPAIADEVEFAGRVLRVTEMDGRRVARVHVSAAAPDGSLTEPELPATQTGGEPTPPG